ncbi:MAG TPA: DUF2268 domain-containing putative Zn-dependent protease [Gemmatimonadaceae bacterium]|nr:DUF2268 domain-containing putative Zn-dependent protease [Gemmatimonadaceae bacterium]
MRFVKTCSFAVLLMCTGPLFITRAAAQDVTRDPDSVRLELGDVRRFAAAVRSWAADGVTDTAAALERDYLAHASPGLRAWSARYQVTAGMLASATSTHPEVYANLDQVADAVRAQEQTLRAAFRKLLEVFPGVAFPPIWFVVGHHGPGGLTQREGVLIAIERLADRPQDVVPLVLHELAHFQQAMVQGVVEYRRIYGPEQTLLALALREGSAELIAELATGQVISTAAREYGEAHEPELWSRFRTEMHDREPGDWMFVRPANPEWPADLGYWMGYRIARTYYDQAADKRQAIVNVIALRDFEGFLAASGYAHSGGR